jgi:multidrug efflux pump subunit AcrA (membrane-fusion protein)
VSRRRPNREEAHFGSDAFLDVIANVVGILIILLVLAGLRSSKVPDIADAPPDGDVVSVDVLAASAAVDLSNEDLAEIRKQELATAESEANRLQSELDKLGRAAADCETRLSELQSQDIATRNRLTALGSTLEGELAALAENRTQREKLSAAAQAVRIKIQKREAEIAAAEKQPHRIEQLEHRITPVSRVLKENETELHFRCFGGQVAPVPIEELVSRMKTQMDRQRDFIIRAKRYSGVVGPVRGFSVKYLVEREESLGGSFVRVMVSQWEVVPEQDLEAESSDVALQNDSVFRNELRKAEPGSTITFWVYPDSFVLYRQLQSIAHREGFAVAARPMPAGLPIMFSPRGSRSAAQ